MGRYEDGQVFINHSEEEIPGVIAEIYREVFTAIKPNDLIGIGVFQRDKDQLAQNTDIAARVLMEHG